MQVVDGTGKGFRAKVDSSNRVSTKSTSEIFIAAKSHDSGDAYQLFAPSLTLGGVAEHSILYFKNTSETRSFAINKYFISWNGGDTNHNRVAFVKQYIGCSEPTANATLSGAGNLNTASANQATMDVYYWDGVGTAGMTVATPGQQAGEVQISQGTSIFDLQGSTVIGPGTSLCVSFTGEEVGSVGVTIEGYFLDLDE